MGNEQTHNKIQVHETIAPQALTDGTATGSTVDRRQTAANFQDAVFVVHAGNWTDGSHAVEFQDSPDDSTWTAIAAAYLDGTEPTVSSDVNDDQVYQVGYLGAERYLRAVIVTTGSTTGAVIGATVILGSPDSLPVN